MKVTWDHGEPLGSINDRKFDQLSAYQLLKRDPVLRN
jgi:hypothetical protein